MEEIWKYVLGLILVYTITYYVFSSFRKGSKFPPGPPRLPFVGNMLSLEPSPFLTFVKMAKRYGPVFSLELGGRDWVIINDYPTIKEAFSKNGDKFSGRPNLVISEQMSKGYGIFFIDYENNWKTQRKFGIRTLKGFGLGKTSFEEKIREEAKYLTDAIDAENEKPFNVQHAVTNAISNMICSIVMGSRFSYDDERFVNITSRLMRGFSDKTDARLMGLMTLVPSFRFIPFFRGAFKRQFEDLDSIMETLSGIIHEHEETFDEENIRDFIDAFINEMRNENKDPSFSRSQMFHYVRDLFFAGTDTTANSFRWCILLLLQRQDCQAKIYEEVKSVLGVEQPSMKHRPMMPYTCAFILEVMRHRTLLPLFAPRKTTAEVQLHGYEIPKGTYVMGNLWSVHHNPKYFDKPEEFRPERYIDENGAYVPCEHVIPFNVGPRQCLGDQLVNMEMFIFLTSIVKRFAILPDPKNPPPSFQNGILGFTYVAHQFKARFARRKKNINGKQ